MAVSIQRKHIKAILPVVYERTDKSNLSLEDMFNLVDKQTFCTNYLGRNRGNRHQTENSYLLEDDSLKRSIDRVCDALVDAIDKHI